MALPLSAVRAVVARPEITVRASPRAVAFAAVLAAYVVLTVCVLVRSPVLTLDQTLASWHLKLHHPGYRPWINGYVIFGQRGPATLAFLPFFGWLAWRQRSRRPLVMLATALVLLNVSVGVVKFAVGRIGPLRVADTDVHQIFAGGDIYPSGHVSNAVVLYGLIAWLAPRFRKVAIGVAVVLSTTVGLATVYLRTHWFSDVVGGWLAGGLVLLAVPTALPYAERLADVVLSRLAKLRTRYARPRPRSVVQFLIQSGETPVNSTARSQSRFAISMSRDRFDEPTRAG